jgi:hemerythrin
MVLVEWRDDFRTGIDAVDFEHHELISLINAAHAELESGTSRRDFEGFLGEIYARISSHFALEERIMQANGYDQFVDHKADHERLLDDIRDIMDEYDAGGYEGLSRELGNRLQAWFVEHFKTKDARLHRLLG